MPDFLLFLLYVLLCAVITYLLRTIPLLVFRKQITNRFIRSFIYYVPYAVLACMTIPAIFFSTSSIVSAVAGFIVAFVLAFFGKSLLIVASSACGTVLLVEFVLRFLPQTS